MRSTFRVLNCFLDTHVTGIDPEGVASLLPASWNQILPWLRQIDGLRQAA
jgi:hypothetical protein